MTVVFGAAVPPYKDYCDFGGRSPRDDQNPRNPCSVWQLPPKPQKFEQFLSAGDGTAMQRNQELPSSHYYFGDFYQTFHGLFSVFHRFLLYVRYITHITIIPAFLASFSPILSSVGGEKCQKPN